MIKNRWDVVCHLQVSHTFKTLHVVPLVLLNDFWSQSFQFTYLECQEKKIKII